MMRSYLCSVSFSLHIEVVFFGLSGSRGIFIASTVISLPFIRNYSE